MTVLEQQAVDQTEIAGWQPAPAEALIPEARRRQRARYRRTGVLAAALVCLIGILVILALLTPWATAGPGQRRASGVPVPAAARSTSVALIRPVLCLAGPATSTSTIPGPLPTSCPPPYAQTPADLGDRPDSGSFMTKPSQNDPALARYSTSSHDTPGNVVLLAAQQSGGQRYLLGPASLKLSPATVTSTWVSRTPYGLWIVDVKLKPAAAAIWDEVAHQAFHSTIAIDFRGSVVSAPLIEPAQHAYSSFDGLMQISGRLTPAFAHSFASALTHRA